MRSSISRKCAEHTRPIAARVTRRSACGRRFAAVVIGDRGERRLRTELLADLAGDRLHVAGAERVFLGEESGEQQAIAERVDPPRNAAAHRVDQVERGRLESRIALPADVVQPVLDVACVSALSSGPR